MASVGFDVIDNATALAPHDAAGKDYSAELHGGSLKGVRLGALNGFWNHTASDETTPVNDVMDDMIQFLRSEGAEIVNVTESVYNAPEILATLDVQQFEYREFLNDYLAHAGSEGMAPASFDDMYSGNNKFLVVPAQYGYISNASVSSTSNGSYARRKLGIQTLTNALHATFSAHTLDAIIYPQQKNLVVRLGEPSQSGRNGILAALTGSPVVAVPAGFSPISADAPVGVPIGMEILGLPFTEARLLNIASHIMRLRPARKMPVFANHSVETRDYAEVPLINPDNGNIPAAYPIGVLS